MTSGELPIVFVTGGAGGIGSAICRSVLDQGWRVVVADLDGDAASALAEELGENAFGVGVDVADQSAVAGAFTQVEEHFGVVTRLVNNAGFADQTPFLEMEQSAWTREFDVMVSGAIHCIRRALPGMSGVRGSAIVNISSVNGLGFYGHPTYSASKAALLSLTQSLAALFGHMGVRINAVAPGTVLTAVWGDGEAQIADRTRPLLDYVPLGKMAVPIDIAQAVLFLLSDAAGQITGTTLTVDGGLTTGILPMAQSTGRSD